MPDSFLAPPRREGEGCCCSRPRSGQGEGAIMSFCGGRGAAFSQLAPQLCTCVPVGARTMPWFFRWHLKKRAQQFLLSAPRLRGGKKSPLRPGGGSPARAAPLRTTGLHFPAGPAAPLTPLPLERPGVGDTHGFWPQVPPSPELVRSTAGGRLSSPGGRALPSRVRGEEAEVGDGQKVSGAVYLKN